MKNTVVLAPLALAACQSTPKLEDGAIRVAIVVDKHEFNGAQTGGRSRSGGME
jgi:hypothetical protein